MTKRPALLPSIHAGRAFAVIAVLGFHLQSINGTHGVIGRVFGSGGHGVDHFFVISGFVMTYAHAGEHGVRAAWHFLGRRFARIYPPYWIVMGVVWAAGYGHITTDPLRAFLLVDQGGPAILQQAWTLTMEVAFYLYFLTFFLSRRMFMVLGVGWCILVLDNWLGTQWYGGGALGSTRILEFFLGIVTAFLVRQLDGWRLSGQVPFVAALLLLGIFYADSQAWMPRYWDVLNYGPASALLIGTAALWDQWAHPRYAGWILEIGNASYATYLLHYVERLPFAALMARTTNGMLQDVIFLVGVLSILSTGSLFHHWIERPLVTQVRTVLT